MQRVFIDVDDTLVKWIGPGDAHPYGKDADTWEPHTELIELVKSLFSHPAYAVIVWSGGGRSYAEYWAQKLLGVHYDVALAKDLTLAQPGDILIDDMELGVKVDHEYYHPDNISEFVRR